MSSFDNSDALDKRQDNIDEEISSEVCSLDFSSDVHLGFIPNDDDQDQEQEQNELFLNPIWSDWDGGKMGGYPIWLDPLNIPTADSLRCNCCGDPMSFLMQLYCPLDPEDMNHMSVQDTHNDAFHRALYVFICMKPSCMSVGEANKTEVTNVKAIRCQLPKLNKYYPSELPEGFLNEDETEIEAQDEYIEEWRKSVSDFSSNTCIICGLKAPFSCSRCKQVHYCSKMHQKLHWSGMELKEEMHKTCCGKLNRISKNPCCFREYPITVVNELDEYEAHKTVKDPMVELAMKKQHMDANEDSVAEGDDKEALLDNVEEGTEEDTTPSTKSNTKANAKSTVIDEIFEKKDEDVTQTDLKLLSGRFDIEKYKNAKEAGENVLIEDHVYNKFISHVNKSHNNQLLRYNRWPELKEKGEVTDQQPAEDTHPCQFGPLRVSSLSYKSITRVRDPMENSAISETVPSGKVSDIDASVAEKTTSGGSRNESVQYIPKCQNCGAPRQFEFQILPQMLYYMYKNENKHDTVAHVATPITTPNNLTATDAAQAKARLAEFTQGNHLDFGAIDVYTCTHSCCIKKNDADGLDACDTVGNKKEVDVNYIAEHVIVQPPPQILC